MRRGFLSIGSSGGTAAGEVELASQAEAEAGSENTKAMTPLRVAQAFAALGGGGGSVSQSLCWVDAVDGDDGTGDGSIGSPFSSLQAAYDARVAGSCSFVIIGEVGPLTLDGTLDLMLIGIGSTRSRVGAIEGTTGGAIRGNGRGMIRVDSIEVRPQDGTAGVDAYLGTDGLPGGEGASPTDLTVTGLHVAGDIRSIGSHGGNGGHGGSGGGINHGYTGAKGGNAGSGGGVTVEDCLVDGEAASYGGNGGNGGNGGDAPDGPGPDFYSGGMAGESGGGGTGGVVTVLNSVVQQANSHSGYAGGGGIGGTGSMTSGPNGGMGLSGSNSTVTLRFTTHLAASHNYGGRELRAVLMNHEFIAEEGP